MAYKHLTYIQRCKIYGLWRAGHNQTEIAKEIGVHKSTISRELKKNITFIRTALGCWQYKPDYAQTYTHERHKNKPKRVKFTESAKQFTREKLLQEWSPEQVSGYAKRHGLFSVSHEHIYQFVLADKQKNGELYKHLRHQHKKYRKRYGSLKAQGSIKNRIFIDNRPKIVDEKARIGDWEIDTIIGKMHKQAIVTIVERKSKKSILKKVTFKTADQVANATIEGLMPFANLTYTITADNGSEFAGHGIISQSLKTDFYFAYPYASWERGLNENTNGLVRQYLKKGSDFGYVTEEDLRYIENKLNNRPRKSLNFMTPTEMFSLPIASREYICQI